MKSLPSETRVPVLDSTCGIAERIFLLFGAISLLWQMLLPWGVSFGQVRGVLLLFWVGVLGIGAYSFLALLLRGQVTGRHWMLGGLGLLCCLIYLFLHRPDSDDGTYLRRGLEILLRPEVPLLGISEVADRNYSPGRFFNTYDMVRVALAGGTGLPYLWGYYLAGPLLFLLLLPFAYDRFGREVLGLSDRHALFLVATSIFILCFWAQMHRSPGNLGIVRMFQGKVVYLTVMVPVLVEAFRRVHWQPSVRNGLLLLVLCGGTLGFSATALTMTLLMAGISLLLVLVSRPWFAPRRILWSALPVVYLAGLMVFLAVVYYNVGDWGERLGLSGLRFSELNEPGWEEKERGTMDRWIYFEYGKQSTLGIFRFTWGYNLFGVLGAVAVLAAVFWGRDRYWRGYSLAFLLLWLFPFTGVWIAQATLVGYGSRWTWIYPAVPVLAWVLVSVASFLSRRSRWLAVAASLLFLAVVWQQRNSIFPLPGVHQKAEFRFSLEKIDGDREINGWTPELDRPWIFYEGQKF